MNKETDPRMHSLEHILNQTMVRMFDRGRAFSAHIEDKKSKCDYHTDRDLTDEEAVAIEKKVNEVIAADLPVTTEMMPKADAEKLFNLSRLPDGTGETLRIVRIGDYDACPCIGTHVTHTKEIGGFRMISHDWTDGVLRVRFKRAGD